MTPLERVRAALESAGSTKQGPADWTCPAHEDKRASLSVKEGREGRVLLRCHAGCTLEAILDALGLSKRDLFPQQQQGERGEIIATYDYTDEHGTLLYQVVRFHPKTFRQRRPDGHGGWTWKLAGTRRILYRLPQILEAVKAGQPVWLAEGEKDVHALERAGVVATCNPMGAGKWRHQYTQALAGGRVMIVADADQAGRDHAAYIAGELTRAGATVQVVEAAKGKDAADHLGAGLSLDDFQPADLPPHDPTKAPTVADLIDVLASYQHLDDPGHVWFSLAVAISGFAELDPFMGDPLWGMLVGPSSSGKTETARALGNLAGHVDDLTASALMSWTKGKNPRPTGVLYRIGDRGVVTIGDFSTVLAMSNKGGRDLLFALLRRAYDGHVTRDLGTAPEQLRWHGRLTILACCTPIIDEYATHADSLGPRWLYYRLAAREAAGKRAMGQAARIPAAEGRTRAAELAERLVAQAVDRAREVAVSEQLHQVLVDIAIVCCYGRASVPRSGYGARDITGLASVEEPPRLVKQLHQLAHALLALGAGEQQALELCRRAALDSIPQARRRVLEELAEGGPLTVSDLARRLACDRKVARFALEELAGAGVLSWPDSYDDDGDGENRFASRTWALDGPEAPLFKRVLRGQPWDEKVVTDIRDIKKERAREAISSSIGPSSSQAPPASEGEFAWDWAAEPVGACVSCGNECFTRDSDGRPRHPLCPPPDPRRHQR
jgi:5S rRNA maturation endonuclease (ribonuclease M5)